MFFFTPLPIDHTFHDILSLGLYCISREWWTWIVCTNLGAARTHSYCSKLRVLVNVKTKTTNRTLHAEEIFSFFHSSWCGETCQWFHGGCQRASTVFCWPATWRSTKTGSWMEEGVETSFRKTQNWTRMNRACSNLTFGMPYLDQ